MNQNQFLLRLFVLAGLVAIGLVSFLNFQTSPQNKKLAQLTQVSNSITSVSTALSSSSVFSSSQSKKIVTPIFNTTLPREKYTNYYYPGLVISYPNDWKIEIINNPSSYKGFLDGGMKLTKGDQIFRLSVRPLATGELQKSNFSKFEKDQKPKDQRESLEEVNLTDQFKRQSWSEKGFGFQPRLVSQVQEGQEEFLIMTNIRLQDLKNSNPDRVEELNKLYSAKYQTIHYLMRMEYEGKPETWSEADDIIRSSKFIFSPLDSIIWNKPQ
jgi:hypothetical protein